MSYVGKSIAYVLLWGAGLFMAAVALWQFYLFVVFRDSRGLLDVQGGGFHLWLAIAAAGLACACVFLGIFRHANKTEEFHITS